jgi:hypothetical protein
VWYLAGTALWYYMRRALTQTMIDHADGSVFFLPFSLLRLLRYFAAIVLGKGLTMWMMG